MRDFDWHTFDELRQYDVRRCSGVIEIRDRSRGLVIPLTDIEFAQLRTDAPVKPKGLL